MRGKITKRRVDALRPAKRDAFIWDTEVPGFGVRTTPAGVRSYVLQYRIGGRLRRYTIGRHGAPWTPDTAREEARGLKRGVSRGADPAEAKRDAREAPTLEEFAERYLSEYAEPKKKPVSVAEDRRLLGTVILPPLGHRKLAAVTRADVSRLHSGMSGTPYLANRALALLSRMMTLAERWGVKPDGTNPCRHVERFREAKRERYLSPAELGRLGEAIAEAEASGSEPRSALAALRMLLLTGLRRSEVLSLRWEDVDLERGVVNLADSKTGARTVRLGAPALALLSALPHEAEYVLPGRSKDGRIGDLQHTWYRIRERAGLRDVRLHDLRHSFASVAASGGSSLIVIGRLLGHREAATTARYAHLSDDPVREAADSTARSIQAALGGKAGEVVSMTSARKGA